MRIPRTWLERTRAAPRLPYGALPPQASALEGLERVDFKASNGVAGPHPARNAERAVRAEPCGESRVGCGRDPAIEQPRLVLPRHESHRPAGRIHLPRRRRERSDGDLPVSLVAQDI